MKGLLPLLGIAALAATMTACGGNSAPTTTSSSGAPPTLHAGKLVVGFDLPAPAFWNGQATGNTIKDPTGFEYGLALDVAQQLGIGKTAPSCRFSDPDARCSWSLRW